MTDQQRWDSLGCYGCEAIATPHLDGLARDGARFDHCYVSNPICTPSRASLMTGKPVPAHGVERLYDVLSPEQPLFPEHLRQAGYATALVGKLHVSAIRHELENRKANDGFDVYEWCPEPSLLLDHPGQAYGRWLEKTHPEFYARLREQGRLLQDVPRECHMTRWAADKTIEFIGNQKADTPFFCLMSVFDPHDPYRDYPSECRNLVDEAKISPVIRDDAPSEELPEAVRREHAHGYMLAGTRKGPKWGSAAPTPEPARAAADVEAFYAPERILRDRADYLASIALLDLEVGRVLSALEDQGIAEETLVIFCSDHGDMLGDHALLAKGAYFYDPSVRVPLLLRWPEKLKGGMVRGEPVQLHDIAATVLRAAGVGPEVIRTHMPDSRDLLACGAEPRDHVVCVYHGTGIADTGRYFDPPIHGAMSRDRRHKLVVYHAPGAPAEIIEGQLFDLSEDPQELHNLWHSPAHAEIRHAMIERLLAWHEDHSPLLASSEAK